MAQWTTFLGTATLLTAVVLLLARASGPMLAQRAGDGDEPAPSAGDGTTAEGYHADASREPTMRIDRADRTDRTDAVEDYDDGSDGVDHATDRAPGPDPADDVGDNGEAASIGSGWLLANVAVSHGLFAAIVIGAAWYTRIPPDALGIGGGRLGGVDAVVGGVAVGIVLYGAAEIGAIVAERFGFDRDESLRTWLAPETGRGWIALLLVVLPLIALFEEFLFRAALIGAASAGLGLSPWPLAVASSAAFALGHGIQGHAGIVVTGIIGFALAATFVLTGSLVAVIVAHYVVNALEFAIHEGPFVERDVPRIANR